MSNGHDSLDVLGPGDRVIVMPHAIRIVRPKGTPSGQIVGDAGDCWAIIWDGTRSVRTIFKPYLQREGSGR